MPVSKGLKRVAVEAESAPGAKNAKSSRLDRDVEANCNIVKAALTDLPVEVAKMLDAVIPLSLGECEDQRHVFQTRVVDAVAGLLHGVEARLKGDVDLTEKEAADAAATKGQRDEAVTEAVENFAAKELAKEGKKRELADDALAFRDLRGALRQAQATQREAEQRLVAASTKLAEAETAVRELLEPLKGTSLPEVESCTKRVKLLEFLGAEVGLDESLMTALPAALEKTPESRGPFDLLAMQELESVMSARVVAIGQEVHALGPAKAETGAAVGIAQAAYDQATGKLQAGAAAFRSAHQEQEDSGASLTDVRKTSKDAGTELRRVTRLVERANGKHTKLQEGALRAFRELRDRAIEGAEGCKLTAEDVVVPE